MAGASEGTGQRTLLNAVKESLELVRGQVDRLSFGSIALTIHDGKVVQLEVTEKRRLT